MNTVSFHPHTDPALEREWVILDINAITKNHGFRKLMETSYPILVKEGRHFQIPKAVSGELMKVMSESGSDKNAFDTAAAAMQYVNLLVTNGQFKCFGSGDDSCPEAILKHLMLNRRGKCITVITQDSRLAADIAGLNRLRAVPAEEILVRRLTPSGTLEEFDNCTETSSVPSFTAKTPAPSFQPTQPVSPVNKQRSAAQPSDTQLLDTALEAFLKAMQNR